MPASLAAFLLIWLASLLVTMWCASMAWSHPHLRRRMIVIAALSGALLAISSILLAVAGLALRAA